ncbi:MAG: MotA/TolQ/ExbB proton channel family protein [Deltaproteobacteria bacterium]|nr:MAG: MotA/TolQ/ExbB proton channel family protein [Deltaproteobacteria bacterium]
MTNDTRPEFRRNARRFLCGALSSVVAVAGGAAAATAATAEPVALNYTVVDLIRFGGWVGYVIIFLSVVAVALVVEYTLSIRLKVLAPAAEVDRLRSLAGRGAWNEIAASLDGPNNPSLLTTIVARGAKEHERGYDAVVKAMEDAADEQTGVLLRKIEHLNMIGNIAPMLGLLGTVLGMVTSFNQISVSVGGVDPRLLAKGIFQALMTTVMGLVVAIPALYAFAIFRNRVDATVAAVSETAEELVEPLKPRGRQDT